MDIKIDPRSVLLLTLDSCRYDTFVSADAPNFHALGPLFRAKAPSYFTYGSHAAMFVGFTPGVADRREAVINPKFAKLFRMQNGGSPGHVQSGFMLPGRSVPEGFRMLGYTVLGTGAAGWFDPSTPTGRNLTADFDEFFYPEQVWGLGRQLAWVGSQLRAAAGKPIFLFLNIGETHVPYYFEGAPWSPGDNPCVPFQTVDRREECRLRQRACLEYVDRQCKPLLEAFAGATIMVTADHGDCWGEDGLWEHGVSHEMTLTVPLVYRLGRQLQTSSAG